MQNVAIEEIKKAFHLTWDNYPEQVRLIDKTFLVLDGNPAYFAAGGKTEVHCNVGDPRFHRGCRAMASLKSGEAQVLHTEQAGMPWESWWVPVAGTDDLFVHFTNGLKATIEKLMGGKE